MYPVASLGISGAESLRSTNADLDVSNITYSNLWSVTTEQSTFFGYLCKYFCTSATSLRALSRILRTTSFTAWTGITSSKNEKVYSSTESLTLTGMHSRQEPSLQRGTHFNLKRERQREVNVKFFNMLERKSRHLQPASLCVRPNNKFEAPTWHLR